MAIAVVCVYLTTNAATALAAPGDFDPSFGQGGVGYVGSFGGGQAVVSKPDGGVAVVGADEDGLVGPPSDRRAGAAFAVGELTPSGAPDARFGGDGSVRTDFSSSDTAWAAWPNDVVAQPDGKLVVIGWAYPLSGTPQQYFALARYNVDGSLDATFGDGGKALVRPRPDCDSGNRAHGAVLQPDGKIVVAGRIVCANHAPFFALVRVTSDGQLDSTFGQSGVTITDFGRYEYATALRVALAPNGSIVAAGHTQDVDPNSPNTAGGRFAVARYTSDGRADTTFSGDGQTIVDRYTNYDFGPRGLAIDPQGKITLAGTGYTDSGSVFNLSVFNLVRFTASGALDPTFDGDGRLTTALGTDNGAASGASGLVLEPSGKLVASGVVAGGGSPGWGLVRYLPDGRLDPSFGKDSSGITIGEEFNGSGGLTKDSEGRLIMGGCCRLVAARFQDDEAKTIAPPPKSYVALGDSVSAGEGIGYGWKWTPGPSETIASYTWQRSGPRRGSWDTRFEPEFCHQTPDAAPRLIESETLLSLLHLSCTGARADDGVLKDRTDSGVPVASAQLGSTTIPNTAPPNPAYDAAKPDLVTLSLGADDVHFAGFVADCYLWKLTCAKDEERADFEAKLVAQKKGLRDVLDEIRRRGLASGKLPLVAITEYYDPFPLAYPQGSDRCIDINPPFPANSLGAEEMSFLRAGLMELQRSIEEVGRAYPNVLLVRPPRDFTSHAWCSRDPWVYGPSTRSLDDVSNQAPFHPTPQGQRAIANAVETALTSQRSVPTGNNVTAPLPGGGFLSFDQVTGAGQIALVPGDQVAGYPIAPNFRLKSGFDLASSVQFSGSATLALPASAADRLYHYVEGRWVEVPSTYANGMLRATMTSFSPYAIGQPASTVRAAVSSSGETLAPAAVSFDASATTTSDRPVTSYQWDFGDGSTASGVAASHVYRTSGNYTATLTATTEDGAVDLATKVIAVRNTPPVAQATGPQAAVTGSPIEVDGSNSSDANGAVDGYAWDFGDGSPQTAGPRSEHTYSSTGRFTVRLTVVDNEGAPDETSFTVQVSAPASPSPSTNPPGSSGTTSPASSPTSPPVRLPTPGLGVAPLRLTVSVKPARVRRRKVSQLALQYVLSRPASLRLDLYRALGKQVTAGRCRGNRLLLRKACYMGVSGSAITVAGQAAASTVPLSRFGRGKVRLLIGKYVLRVRATSGASTVPTVAYAYFRVT